MKKRSALGQVAIPVGLPFFMACALASATTSPELNIASKPMFNGRSNVHPNMLLSLSVEFPTVGAAYRGNGGTYNRIVEYIGYFNPKKCYRYQGSYRNPVNDPNDSTYDRYFYISKSADELHECGGDSFSGNFMNWAASSAIDMFRYALTGGDRIIDTPTVTILQRAVLQDSTSTNFYANGTYFPRRVVTASGDVSAPKMVTPFDAKTLYVVSCRNRILFSDSTSGSVDSKIASGYCTSQWDGNGTPPSNAIDKKFGDFLVRVRVCDDHESAERRDLCQPYGSGYKPVGQVQRNAEKLRIGAMGYLLDDSASRYGGVLRAPIKYVGSRKRNSVDLVESDNEKLEWDSDTGVFYNNPEVPSDRNGTSNSGVVNYLNKFGRSGVYKRYDPVSELYYESIRYFQGKQPTLEATANVSEAMKDGFPVIASWEDPVIASCQSNYIVSIADVNTHWDRYIPGNNRTTFGTNGANAYDNARFAESAVDGKFPALDILKWTQAVGDMEIDVAGTFKNPAKNSNLSGLEAKDTGASGHGTYYMSGLAYWANTNDIRLDKRTRVKTFTVDVDEGGNGQIDGNPRTLKPRDSQLYLAAKYGGFEAKTKENNPFITLSDDGKEVGASYVEWSDGVDTTAVPRNYFLASQPKELISSISKVFAAIADSSGTISGVSASTTRISTDGTYVYQPGFESSGWGGSLKKMGVTVDANGAVIVGKKPEWDAGAILTGAAGKAAEPAPDARKIYTAKFGNDNSMSTVEFKWTALSDQQKMALDLAPYDDVSDGRGIDRVNFMRGSRDLESDKPNGIFRIRKRILGDIVNGNPLFVGSPASNVQGVDYQKFYEDHKGRTNAVYIGANDGMLHAFRADDGKELFAYVPNALIPGLNRITSPRYQHQPYADGVASVSEARIGPSWKTILVSGMGGGAQGVFALDVTDPANFEGGSKAIFEFTDADDPDMGNVMGAPVIAKFQTGYKNGVPEYKYFTVVGSGLNNYKADGEKHFNTDAAGALFLLSLDKSPSVQWTENVNYFKIRVPSSNTELSNGLGTPAIVLGAMGATRYVYAGDLQGQLWRFDFTGMGAWAESKPAATLLFVARDALGIRQPVTVQPKVVFAPGGGYVVLFGTGKFVEEADAAPGNFSAQSFYGVLDTTGINYTVAGRSELNSRVIEKYGDGFKISGASVAYGMSQAGKGWYIDFFDSANTGERSISNPLILNGRLFFNSLIPARDPCDPGSGRSYVLDTLTGLPSNDGVTGFLSVIGMLSAPVPFEMGVEVSDRNAIGKRIARKKYTVVNFGTGRKPGAGEAASGEQGMLHVPAGRFSWREVPNWQELRNAFSKK